MTVYVSTPTYLENGRILLCSNVVTPNGTFTITLKRKPCIQSAKSISSGSREQVEWTLSYTSLGVRNVGNISQDIFVLNTIPFLFLCLSNGVNTNGSHHVVMGDCTVTTRLLKGRYRVKTINHKSRIVEETPVDTGSPVGFDTLPREEYDRLLTMKARAIGIFYDQYLAPKTEVYVGDELVSARSPRD